jgi:hypothetical protein
VVLSTCFLFVCAEENGKNLLKGEAISSNVLPLNLPLIWLKILFVCRNHLLFFKVNVRMVLLLLHNSQQQHKIAMVERCQDTYLRWVNQDKDRRQTHHQQLNCEFIIIEKNEEIVQISPTSVFQLIYFQSIVIC